MMRVRWTVRAQSDLDGIDLRYRTLDRAYAERIGQDALAAGRFLGANPFAGPMIETTTERKWRVARTPYLLIYRVLPSELQILRVRHAAEDWRPA